LIIICIAVVIEEEKNWEEPNKNSQSFDYLIEEKSSTETLIKINIDKNDNKKQEIYDELRRQLANIENSKKRYREEESFTNPFLKLVKVTTDN